MPAGSDGKVKLPVVVVVVWKADPLAVFFATTTAPGTIELAGSWTVPVMVPRSACANTAPAHSKLPPIRVSQRIFLLLEMRVPESYHGKRTESAYPRIGVYGFYEGSRRLLH